MFRVLLLATTIVAVNGTTCAQVSTALALTDFAHPFTVPVENSAPAKLAQPSNSVSSPSTPCSLRTVVPANHIAPGSFPDAPSAYVPLSSHCKFEIFVRQTYSPYTLTSAAFDATVAQMFGQWPQFGGGMEGWSKRLGTSVANYESRRFIQNFVLATLLHEDPRYFPSGKHGVIPRGWYAATRVLITRNDNGWNVLNRSEFLGASFTSALQNTYYPRPDRTFGATMDRFLGTFGDDATNNLLHEFGPDLKRLFHKHCPQGIQRFEARMPIPESVKP